MSTFEVFWLLIGTSLCERFKLSIFPQTNTTVAWEEANTTVGGHPILILGCVSRGLLVLDKSTKLKVVLISVFTVEPTYHTLLSHTSGSYFTVMMSLVL